MNTKTDRGAYLGALFAAAAPSLTPRIIADDVAALRRIARSLDSLAIAACNYGLSPRQETRQSNLAAQAVALAEPYGFRCETSGDPRGYVVKLFDPENETRGDGFCGGWGVF